MFPNDRVIVIFFDNIIFFIITYIRTCSSYSYSYFLYLNCPIHFYTIWHFQLAVWQSWSNQGFSYFFFSSVVWPPRLRYLWSFWSNPKGVKLCWVLHVFPIKSNPLYFYRFFRILMEVFRLPARCAASLRSSPEVHDCVRLLDWVFVTHFVESFGKAIGL